MYICHRPLLPNYVPVVPLQGRKVRLEMLPLLSQCSISDACWVHAVTLQGKQLKEKKNAQHHAWRFEDGAYIETTWDRFKAGLGNTVIVQTGADNDMMNPCMPATYATLLRAEVPAFADWLFVGCG